MRPGTATRYGCAESVLPPLVVGTEVVAARELLLKPLLTKGGTSGWGQPASAATILRLNVKYGLLEQAHLHFS